MKTFLICLACAAVVVAAGCDSAPNRTPKTTKTVFLTPGRPSPDVGIDVVSAIRIVLPGPVAGADLVWEIAANNNRVLEQMSALEPGPARDAPSTVVSFYTLKPGRSVLRFFLVHPNQAETVPVAKCEVTVRVSD